MSPKTILRDFVILGFSIANNVRTRLRKKSVLSSYAESFLREKLEKKCQ
jgi:hypothetical protein